MNPGLLLDALVALNYSVVELGSDKVDEFRRFLHFVSEEVCFLLSLSNSSMKFSIHNLASPLGSSIIRLECTRFGRSTGKISNREKQDKTLVLIFHLNNVK